MTDGGSGPDDDLAALRARVAAVEAENAALRERHPGAPATEGARMFDLSPDLQAIVNADGTLSRANPAFARALGYTQEQMQTHSFRVAMHPDDQARMALRFQRLSRGDIVPPIRNRYFHRDGSIRYLEWNSIAVDGVVYATGRDVTALQRQEDVHAAQRRVLELVAADTPLPVVLDALLRQCEAIAPTVYAGVYITEDDGRSLRAVASPRLPMKYAAAVARIPVAGNVGACGHAAWSGAVTVCEDIATSPAWVDYRDVALEAGLRACWSTPLLTPGGKVLGTLVGYLLEPRAPTTTEREVLDGAIHVAQIAVARFHAAEELRLLRKAVATMNDSVIVYDAPTPDDAGPRIRFVNPAFQRQTGWTPLEVVNHPLRAVAETPGPQELWTALALGRSVPAAVEVRSRAGTVYWVEADVSPLPDDTGRVTHQVAIVRDVTARRELEHQLRQAQKMEAVGQLAGGVAHDFNNILTAVVGFTEEALQGLPEGNTRECLMEVRTATGRATSLTRQLLAFSRRQMLQVKVVDLGELLRSMERLLHRVLPESINLAVGVPPDLKKSRCDPGQVEQVVLNLVVNARDAMPAGGRLTVEACNATLDASDLTALPDVTPGDYVAITVTDTGTGMSASTRARLFEPFFTTKPPGQGTGLGLAMSYGIVKQLGGHITVASEPGRGAVFRVYLPQAPEVAATQTSREVDRAPGGRETILLAEDDDAVRLLARRVLARRGYTVLEATNGRLALDLVRSAGHAVDLLLTDVVMPAMGGPELAAAVRALHPDVSVLFMSGYTRDAALPTDGPDDTANFLSKPFTVDTLATKVRAVLDARRRAPGDAGDTGLSPRRTVLSDPET